MPPAGDRAMSLEELQRWFLEHVVSPQRQAPAATLPAPAVGQVILPSRTLDAEARLGIYSEAYFLRLREIMAGEHGVIELIVGDDAFSELCRGYLSRYPSRSPSLNNLAHAFPHYLQRFCTRSDLPLLLDVARVERALSDAYDTPSYRRIGLGDLTAVPAEHWAEVRFRMDPSVRVMAFNHDVYGIIDAHRNGRELPDLGPQPCFAVVWRNERVWRRPLSRPRYEALSALAGGATMATALERAAAAWEGDAAELESQVFEWFAEWLREGFFSALARPGA